MMQNKIAIIYDFDGTLTPKTMQEYTLLPKLGIEPKNFWKVIPPKLTPISRSVYKKIDHDDFDVIISCGRKSVIPSIHLKNKANKTKKILKRKQKRPI